MFRPVPHAFASLAAWLAALDERWPSARRRAGSLALVLAIEIAILLALLSLGAGRGGYEGPRSVVTTFDAQEAAQPARETVPEPDQAAPESPKQPAAPVEALPQEETVPGRPPPPALLQTPTPAPTSAPPPAAPVTPAKPKITAVIRSDRAGPPAPANAGVPGDSERIAGSGPNGEPLYRAKWYREPYPDELRGYLSTTPAPAWALINCQTQPEYRVDHCVLVEEYPRGSNMGSAVLNAAWQFKVRPPRVGGRVMVGEWVRIRIDYTRTPG